MARLVKVLLAAVLALVAAPALAACSSSDEPAAPDGAVVIDVRTPQEYAAGHLEGALNIDVEAADFADRVGELDVDATYVLYCRSGNRAGAAAAQMAELGFAHVTNAGGLDEAASATGLAVVAP